MRFASAISFSVGAKTSFATRSGWDGCTTCRRSRSCCRRSPRAGSPRRRDSSANGPSIASIPFDASGHDHAVAGVVPDVAGIARSPPRVTPMCPSADALAGGQVADAEDQRFQPGTAAAISSTRASASPPRSAPPGRCDRPRGRACAPSWVRSVVDEPHVARRLTFGTMITSSSLPAPVTTSMTSSCAPLGVDALMRTARTLRPQSSSLSAATTCSCARPFCRRRDGVFQVEEDEVGVGLRRALPIIFCSSRASTARSGGDVRSSDLLVRAGASRLVAEYRLPRASSSVCSPNIGARRESRPASR